VEVEGVMQIFRLFDLSCANKEEFLSSVLEGGVGKDEKHGKVKEFAV
jgi:hypothetical protein